jgi:hypothetical protein
MKISLILYLFHPDLWNEFKFLLYPIKDKIKLYLGLCEENDNSFVIKDSQFNFDTKITFHKNYGADVASFLDQLQSVEEEFFIKLHSKKSFLGIKNHINWRSVLLHDLIGNKYIFEKNLSLIKNEKIGCVCSRNLLVKSNLEKEISKKKIKEICEILSINTNKKEYFCAGNMFLSKTQLFLKVFENNFEKINNLLKQEKKKVFEKQTGTYSHSLERIFGYIISSENLKFAFAYNDPIFILNNKSPNKKYLSMIRLYNNNVYILENINIFGTILKENKEEIIIKWKNIDKNQKYIFIKKKYIKNQNFEQEILIN